MLKYVILLLVLVAGTVSAHDWHSVWIAPVTMMDLRMLEEEGFLVEGLFGNRARLYVDNEEEEMLRHLGYSPVAEERHEPLVPYPSLSEIYIAIDAVVAAHPDICRLEIIGTSVQGREIRAVVVSDNIGTEEVEPELRLHGGIHGDEMTGVTVTLHYLETLTDNYGTSAMCTYVVDTAESWIIPVLNPDGYYLDQRYNANGIDLNRNCSYMGPGGGGGSVAFSEPETSALRDITMKSWPAIENFENPFVTGLSMHGGAACINTPWNYTENPLPEDYDLMYAHCQLYAYSPGIVSYFGSGNFDIWLPGASWYPTNGDVNDWSYGEVGTVDHTLEVHFDKQASDWPGVNAAHYLAILSFMQYSTYGIYGTVTDQWGNPFDALIQIGITDDFDSTPLRFCRSDVTLGDYAKNLVPGTYDVTASVVGFTSQSVLGVEVGIDERVEVNFLFTTTGVGESGINPVPGTLSVTPNPVNSACVFSIPAAGVEGRLGIYDIVGRMVHSEPVPAGVETLQWDGCSREDGKLPSGVYIATYTVSDDVVSVRFVIGN
jgi:hypothetical protein